MDLCESLDRLYRRLDQVENTRAYALGEDHASLDARADAIETSIAQHESECPCNFDLDGMR